MATTPALGSLSTEDLAAKVRAKFPGAYDDKPDGVLVGAWLKKYPDYGDYLTRESQAQLSATANAQATITKPIDQLQEKRFSIFTPTGDVPKEQLQATTNAQNVVTGATGALTAAPAVVGAFAPTAAGTTAVGTGILDAGGSEITKDVAQYGPSMARAGVNLAVNAIRAHPYISSVIATHLANALGVPVPKVLKAITLIPTGPAE